VLLECDVGPTGLVSRVEVIGSSGCGDLDRAAAAAVRRAVFLPAIEGGRPVGVTVRQPVTFQLRRG
jgi:TonB family protein